MENIKNIEKIIIKERVSIQEILPGVKKIIYTSLVIFYIVLALVVSILFLNSEFRDFFREYSFHLTGTFVLFYIIILFLWINPYAKKELLRNTNIESDKGFFKPWDNKEYYRYKINLFYKKLK